MAISDQEFRQLQREARMLRIALRLAFRTINALVRVSGPGAHRAVKEIIPLPQEAEALRFVNQTSS